MLVQRAVSTESAVFFSRNNRRFKIFALYQQINCVAIEITHHYIAVHIIHFDCTHQYSLIGEAGFVASLLASFSEIWNSNSSYWQKAAGAPE